MQRNAVPLRIQHLRTEPILTDRVPIRLHRPPIRITAASASFSRRRMPDLIATASGEYVPKAVELGQDDFLPWNRGVSL